MMELEFPDLLKFNEFKFSNKKVSLGFGVHQ